jgi:hypothetical protein
MFSSSKLCVRDNLILNSISNQKTKVAVTLDAISTTTCEFRVSHRGMSAHSSIPVGNAVSIGNTHRRFERLY